MPSSRFNQKVLSKIEKQLAWESSILVIKTVEKLKTKHYMVVTNLKEKKAMPLLKNPRPISVLVNGEWIVRRHRCPYLSALWIGKRKGHLYTILLLAHAIKQHWIHHSWFKPPAISDSDLRFWFLGPPIILQVKNRQWTVIRF